MSASVQCQNVFSVAAFFTCCKNSYHSSQKTVVSLIPKQKADTLNTKLASILGLLSHNTAALLTK